MRLYCVDHQLLVGAFCNRCHFDQDRTHCLSQLSVCRIKHALLRTLAVSFIAALNNNYDTRLGNTTGR